MVTFKRILKGLTTTDYIFDVAGKEHTITIQDSEAWTFGTRWAMAEAHRQAVLLLPELDMKA